MRFCEGVPGGSNEEKSASPRGEGRKGGKRKRTIGQSPLAVPSCASSYTPSPPPQTSYSASP